MINLLRKVEGLKIFELNSPMGEKRIVGLKISSQIEVKIKIFIDEAEPDFSSKIFEK
jgi:hypothetical protein